MKKIGIACDHAGYEMKEFLVGYLDAMGYEVLDFGTHSPESVDYPDYAHPLAEAIEAGSLTGQWSGEVVVGRPPLADEPLDVISFKVPHSAALAIKRAAEQEGESRSAFLRKAALDRAESVLAAS